MRTLIASTTRTSGSRAPVDSIETGGRGEEGGGGSERRGIGNANTDKKDKYSSRKGIMCVSCVLISQREILWCVFSHI